MEQGSSGSCAARSRMLQFPAIVAPHHEGTLTKYYLADRNLSWETFFWGLVFGPSWGEFLMEHIIGLMRRATS